MIVTAQQGDTVERICDRYLGTTAGITEEVLRTNPGVAALGPVLPRGTRLEIPSAPPAREKKVVNLWD
ncbi:MAG: tail protein X [Gammaproteobacteria bacterium]|nr:tail protein X [Gammaproteobacteria bacterium]